MNAICDMLAGGAMACTGFTMFFYAVFVVADAARDPMHRAFKIFKDNRDWMAVYLAWVLVFPVTGLVLCSSGWLICSALRLLLF